MMAHRIKTIVHTTSLASMKTAALVLALLFGGGVVSAQVLDSTVFLTTATLGGRDGYLAASPSSAGGSTLTWNRHSAAGVPAQSTSAGLPMNRPWSAREAGSGTYLVVGADVNLSVSPATRDAVVVAVHLDPATSAVNVVSSAVYPGRDFSSVYFNSAEQLCYVIDSSVAGLMMAPWTIGGGLPTTFSLIADSTNVPFLAGKWLPFLRARSVASGVGIRARDTDNYYGDVLGYSVHYAGPTWVVESDLRPGTGSDLPQWEFGSYFQNTRSGSVSVTGVVGQFAVALAGGGDVVTGATASVGVTTIPVATGALLPGASYTVRGLTPTASTSPILPINSSWGQRCPGASVDMVRGLVADCYVGNGNFSVASQLHWRTESAVVESRDVFLVLGFAIPGAEDVSVGQNGCATMGTIAAILGPFQTKINGPSPGLARVNLPVPGDPGLTGLHVLMQWVAADGSGFALSEVFGTLIFPAPTASAFGSGSGGGGPLVPGSPAAHQARQCAENWRDSRPEMAWNHVKRELRKALKRL